MMNAEQIAKARKILLEVEEMPPTKADTLLREFPPLHDPLPSALQSWLVDHIIPHLEVEGIAIKAYMQNRGCHFLTALRELDRLLDPELPAGKRARLLDIMRKPVRLK